MTTVADQTQPPGDQEDARRRTETSSWQDIGVFIANVEASNNIGAIS
jgi:hypothetical protein